MTTQAAPASGRASGPLARARDAWREAMAIYREDGGADVAALRAHHIASVLRLTPMMMAANVAVAAVVAWAFAAQTPLLFSAWAMVLAYMVGTAMSAWRRSLGRTRASASLRAVQRATWHSAGMATLWAAVPVIWFHGASAPNQLLVAIITSGMMAAGTFTLGNLPRASLSYLGMVLAGALVALFRTGDVALLPVAVLIPCFGFVCALNTFSMAIKANALLRSEREAERQREMVTLLLRDFEEHATEALWECDAQGRLVHASPRLAQLLGVAPALLAGRPLVVLLRAASQPAALELQALFTRGHPVRRMPMRLGEGSQARQWMLSAKPLAGHDGSVQGWRGVIVDVSAEMQAAERLRQLAHFDALTGLANRVTLHETLRTQISAKRSGALLAMDLDNFKAINDTLGHSTGDALLVAVARRLHELVRSGDLVARIGGDEFAVLMPGAAADAEGLAQRLVQAFESPLDVDGRHLNVGLSVGVALLPAHGEAVDELIGHADLALYAAKEGGRGRAAIYSPELGERRRRAAAIEHGLEGAIARGELSLHWQPRWHIGDARVVGAEALLRWRHPELGEVEPSEFVPVAERTGLIVPIGAWVLREAARCAAERLAGLRISINISGVQLRDKGFVALVRNTLAEAGLPAERVDLEITESVFIADLEGAVTRLRRLQSLGVKVALDDFGTGYSSLAYLRRSGFDQLKIDRAFIAELDQRGGDGRAIVSAILSLAASLRMHTIAEGVETAEQLKIVSELGCKEVQGFGIAKPQPIDDLCRLLMSNGAPGSGDLSAALTH